MLETPQILRLTEMPNAPDETGEGLLRPGAPPFRAWVPVRRIAVLGNSQDPARELLLPAITEDSVPIFRRIGGGGTVILDNATCCYALRLPRHKDWSIPDYFRMGSAVLQKTCAEHLGIHLEPQGISDLSIEGRKILGCSLYMPRHCALYLASVLVKDSTEVMDRYLAHPSREPDYRKGRTHRDFVTHLSAFRPGLTPALVVDWLQNCALSELLDWETP